MAALGLIVFLLADMALLFVALVLVGLSYGALRAVRHYSSRVVRFEIHLEQRMDVGSTKTYAATNFKDAAGQPVDLDANPTAFAGLSWSVDDVSKATLSNAVGRSVELLGLAEGTVTLTATGKNVSGEDVTASMSVSIAAVIPPPPPVPVVASFEIVEQPAA
jgi:hypothetical protein